MNDLELMTDLQLQDYIDDLNYLLDFGCTIAAANRMRYELSGCLEILRRRNYDPTIDRAPEWFDHLLNGDHEAL